jgi:hypothetical protein
VSTPDLCSASVTDPVISSDSQICIEVASVWCLMKRNILSCY